jgi:hypothetical protein
MDRHKQSKVHLEKLNASFDGLNDNQSPKINKSKILPCGKCDKCLLADCGTCNSCLNKIKFGGNGSLRKRCEFRSCPIQQKLKQELRASKDPKSPNGEGMDMFDSQVKEETQIHLKNLEEMGEESNNFPNSTEIMNYDYELIPEIISEQIIVDLIGQISFAPLQYETATTPNQYTCRVCEDSFASIDQLTKHLSLAHEGKKPSQMGLKRVNLWSNELENVTDEHENYGKRKSMHEGNATPELSKKRRSSMN